MIFKLNSKLLTLGSHYQIRDEADNLVFSVKGKILSFGHDLTIENANGMPVARIQQRLLNFMPTFDLILGGKHFAKITKKFSWFKKCFLLDVPGPNDYDIEGNFWNYEYEFRRKSGVVAKVSRKFFSLTDVYGVEMLNSEDPIAVLSAVVVIDLCNQSNNSN